MKVFTPTEKQFIKDHLEDMTFKEIAETLGRDKCTVEIKARKLGFKKVPVRKNHKGIFSKEEDKFIIENYDKLIYSEIAKHLNRSVDSIRGRADLLGFKNKKAWSYPTLKMIKQNMALRSNLKPEDIPNSLAELKQLQIELKNSL
jgi:hypothetical protein